MRIHPSPHKHRSDPEAIQNLRYFVQEGVAAGDGCEYVFVVQRGEMRAAEGATVPSGDPAAAGVYLPLHEGDLLEDLDLPALPRNARYVVHKNECYDWGTFGWLLASKQARVD